MPFFALLGGSCLLLALRDGLPSSIIAVVWAWLLRATLWPAWYANSSDVRFLSHTGPDLGERTRFRWKTFGLVVTCTVREFQAPYGLAWEANRAGWRRGMRGC